MEEMGNLFPIVECQLMNVESIMEIESYHLAAAISDGRFRQETSMDA